MDIDLNSTGEEAMDDHSSSSSSGTTTGGVTTTFPSPYSCSSASVCLELWQACAGPLISLPNKGSFVVYLPQGHLEQTREFVPSALHLPPHVFCRVVDVQLHVSLSSPLFKVSLFFAEELSLVFVFAGRGSDG